jgi:hypothetical protein
MAACALAMVAGNAHAACREGAVETRHQARIAGKTLAYTACAGLLPIRNDAGEVRGSIFYTAYLVEGRAKRPLSFIWNGGPGADSRLLHFHALGPRTLQGGKLADNPVSLLAASDLVFVDPVGTGFSLPARPEYGADFYGTLGDIAATARFIRGFRAAYAREASPLYLIGESFGTWRATGVADLLADQRVKVAGVALISGGIPLGDWGERALMRALSVPNRTATAFALGLLPADLQADRAKTLAAAERWARDVYYPALARPDALTPETRANVIAQAARFHGLDPADIDAKTLWVTPRDFRTRSIAGKTLDVFDMRRHAASDGDGAENRAILAYYRGELGYAQGSHAGLEPAPGARNAPAARWQYDQSPMTAESVARAQAGEGPPSPSQPWTLRAMEKVPTLRTWVAAGVYDSLNSCAANFATVRLLPKAIARRVVLQCYAGGHMMYDDSAVAVPFGRDLAAFVSGR